MKQYTLSRDYYFEGKGLHSGRYSHVRLSPAPVNTGVVFVRKDLGLEIPALAENVSSTIRSTTLSCGKASVRTVEHILSALTGLGVDNAYVELDNVEMPILDGSARLYVEAIEPDGLKEQDACREWVEIDRELELRNGKTGSWIKITPADSFSIDVTIDFDSWVIGKQAFHWDESMNYPVEVAPCRTFCFLREILLLSILGLAKGGDVENAIVIVDKPVKRWKMAHLSRLFHQPQLTVTSEGYLSNLTLRFPNECCRHKMLDIIGDIRLCGGFPKAHIEAYKPGHSLNTGASKLIRKETLYGKNSSPCDCAPWCEAR